MGRFGSVALNLALAGRVASPLMPLPAPEEASDEAILLRRLESSAGVPLLLLVPPALLGFGKAVVGGGEVGGPYALDGGTLYCAHCSVGSDPVVGAVGVVVDGGCFTIRSGCGVPCSSSFSWTFWLSQSSSGL